MNHGPPLQTYRLTVVFDNGLRVVGLTGLSEVQAREFQTRLLELTTFKTVLVEPESDGKCGAFDSGHE
jgi:hypothetical protein